jgi:hypothetical protein
MALATSQIERDHSGDGTMEQHGYWYSTVACPECNEGQLTFAVRKAGRTHYLLCLNCGANYKEPPQPGEHNPAFDTPVEELNGPWHWASQQEIAGHGWSVFVAGFCRTDSTTG